MSVVGRSRPARPDPLSPCEVEMTVRLLDSVRRVLDSYIAGRRSTGGDAMLLREACRRLGSVVAAVERGAES